MYMKKKTGQKSWHTLDNSGSEFLLGTLFLSHVKWLEETVLFKSAHQHAHGRIHTPTGHTT